MGTTIRHPVPDRVKLSFVIFNIRALVRTLKITNDGLTPFGTGCFIAVPIMATVGAKGLADVCVMKFTLCHCVSNSDLLDVCFTAS